MASRHVVLGYDGSSTARTATDRAIRLARGNGDTDIVLVCAHERPPDFSGSPFLLGSIDETRWWRDWQRETAEDLDHEAMRIRLAGVDATVTCSPEDPVRLLEDVAARVGAECIVVPDDDEGLLHDLIVGSSVRRLKRTSPVPVVAVRNARDRR
jgi:nucleotide-binding universal stress UspA family protein